MMERWPGRPIEGSTKHEFFLPWEPLPVHAEPDSIFLEVETNESPRYTRRSWWMVRREGLWGVRHTLLLERLEPY